MFVKVVKHKQLDICAASKAVKAWLGLEGIASRLISSRQMLSIKANTLTTIYKVEEVKDSKDKAVLFNKDTFSKAEPLG